MRKTSIEVFTGNFLIRFNFHRIILVTQACSGPMTTDKAVLSVNVGEIREVLWKGKIIRTGIYKHPTVGTLKVEGVNIAGDDQADRRVHGGKNKAVYAYPHEHYQFWKQKYSNLTFTSGMFGENLTTTGILEKGLYIGDILKIGSCELIVTEPRMPCFKLGIKFGTQKIIKQFTKAQKPGFYLKIAKEGEIKTGDTINLVPNNKPKLTILDTLRIYRNQADRELLNKALEEPHLPSLVHDAIRKILDK